MGEGESSQQPHPGERLEPFPPTRVDKAPVLSTASTGAYLLLWSFLMVYGWSAVLVGDPTSRLQSPARSAARMTDRDLELVEALEALPSPGRRRLWEWIYGSREEVLANAVAIHQDVVFYLEARASGAEEGAGESLERARAQLSVLLAEAGERAEAYAIAETITSPPDFAAGMRHAYGGAPAPPEDPLDIFEAAGLSGWSYLRVAEQLAGRRGDVEDAQEIEAELLERGGRWLRRSTSVVEANLVLGLLAVAVVGLGALRAGRRAPAAVPPVAPPPWLLVDGLGVLVRGDCWNRLYYVSLSALEQLVPGTAETPVGELLSTWGSLIASLPLLWLTYRYLLRPHWRVAGDSLGLLPPLSAWSGLAAVAVVALGIDLIGTYALGWSSWGLGADGHWAEGFDENLVWGPPRTALLTAVDYIVWAPAVEELAFRGVLFLSLRRRFGLVGAAALSGAIFSLIHFYGLPGFLMTFWSGFVWALALERARSLWPGIAAHSVYNLLYVAGLVLVYR